MSSSRIEQFDKIVNLRKVSNDRLIDYWQQYSDYSTWQFWLMIAMFVVPLIILVWRIDRSRALLLGFFGFSFHMVFAYTDMFGMIRGFWHYPYQIFPHLPSISLDSALVPVIFILVFQWTIHHKKSYFLYALLTAAVLSFGLKPLLVKAGLFRLYDGITYVHLFMFYIVVVIAARGITYVFEKLQEKGPV
ncbi:hypothetical protein V1498_19295 [Peribacillus sp. SCS-26]|uniref:hypothetical protein n=1 Tax=Paraperibacillus marinus TaxID=3115295 RepID=UPI003905D55D